MRNRYLDLLRAVATVRVVVYHSTGWAALTIVFPAMSVMFALAGSMMAASLDRHGPGAVERRFQRLLPSLWVLAAVAVPAMLVGGLAWDWTVLLWFFPLQDPPATGFWLEGLAATWYLRDFLWLVLLSPLVRPIFRRFPVPVIATPYVALAVITFAELSPPPVVRDLALYGGAWLLGFAHHDGLLARRRWWPAGLLAAAGAAWTLTHPGPRGFDLNDIPLGNALWSAAVIMIALSFTPDVRGRRILTVLNARALTIYLWHVPLIIGVVRFAEATGLPVTGWVGISWRLAVVAGLLAAVVLLVGWVEDLAAGRRPALLPGRRPELLADQRPELLPDRPSPLLPGRRSVLLPGRRSVLRSGRRSVLRSGRRSAAAPVSPAPAGSAVPAGTAVPDRLQRARTTSG